MYWGSGRNRYQLEIPESVLSRSTSDEYELMSQKKGYRRSEFKRWAWRSFVLFLLFRYWTKEIQGMLEKLVDAESRRDTALRDTMRSLFSSFDQQSVSLLYPTLCCVTPSDNFSTLHCSFPLWECAVRCLATLDVLCSLATYR